MSDISHDIENLKEKERQGNLSEMGMHLRREPRLTSEYSRVAGTRVEIFFDNAIKRYVLKYKSKPIMWFVSDTSTERNRVRKHFAILRNGIAPRDKYKEAWDLNEKNARDKEKQVREFAEHRGKEDSDMIQYYLFDRGRRSVVIEGDKNGKR